MKFIRKKAWPIWGMILLTLFLTVIIIIASTKNPGLLWALLVAIPLFLIAVYLAWHTDHLPQKNFASGLEAFSREAHGEWISHSVYPTRIDSADLRVKIGNDQCSQPYDACIFNVASKAEEDYEGDFIDRLQEKASKSSGVSVSEGLQTYHLAAGGLVWQIGPGYIGCRTDDGHFNSKAFKKVARRQEIKMIELKLSSVNSTNYLVDSFLGIPEAYDGKIRNSIFSDTAFTTFNDAEGMVHFLSNLRELSGGKPIGIRICINNKKEFYQICYAIRKTQIIPDFIVVEGTFDRTDIVYFDQAIDTEMELYDAVMFVKQTLQMYGLENKIVIVADGKIISCFDILKVLALGADVVCTEMPRYRVMKYAGDGGKLSLQLESQNVYDFHNNLMEDTVKMMKICGFRNTGDITLSKLFSWLDVIHAEDLARLSGQVLHTGSVKKIYN